MTKVFANGLIIKLPMPTAPKWVKAKLSFKVAEFVEFLKKNDNGGWVNVDMLISQDGSKLYGALNTYKKGEPTSKDSLQAQEVERSSEPTDDVDANSIPF